MKNKRYLGVTLSTILLIVASLSHMCVEVFANGIETECKNIISEHLKNAMENSSDNDVFSVWLYSRI